MTQNELREKYVKFLQGFGIALSDAEIDRRMKLEFVKPNFSCVYEDTPTRQEAINAYLITCEDFGFPISENIKNLYESEIWDYALNNINIKIRERFSDQLAMVSDVVRRKHVKDAITALFDQRIYITRTQVEQLIEAAKDNEEIVDVYLSFGGEKGMFEPSVLYSDDEYLQDCYEGDDDDEYYNEEEEVEA